MHAQFHHVSLLARHGQENQSFYTKLLGLRFVKNTVNQDNNRMPHYFYGDYQGTPGSLVTFFIVPLLGNRYEEKNYLATIGLKIPQNSLSFWEQRLTENKIPFNKKEKSLHFSDPDDTHIILTEVPENPLKETLVVSNDIPAAVQIIGLASTEFHVPDSEKTLAFFETFLGWQAVGNTIILSETEMLSTEDFDFDLPEELIAQTPLKDRASSRLLVVNKETGDMEDKHFHDILDELQPGDALVMNNTRVLPARLYGEKPETGGHLEVLLLTNTEGDTWETLIKPAKRAKVGTEIQFGDGRLKAVVKEELEHGGRIIEFKYDGIFLEILESLGEMPLPPYIKERLDDPDRYQTVYAEENGSAAAPTAGLHFTKELLEEIKAKGVHLVYLTLHVGLGTFRPVSVDNIEEHHMHSEFYRLTEEAAKQLNEVRQAGGRIVAVGTTSIRTLETIGTKFNGEIQADSGWTDIFITPGYQFKVVEAFSTNFHLPKSTLVMLVSAFAGKDLTLAAYKHAIKEKYRFFSFGDAMFIK